MSESPSRAAIAAFLRDARRAMQMNQADFGGTFGRSQGTVHFWENGTTVPDYELMVSIAIRSGVPLPLAPELANSFASPMLTVLMRLAADAQARLPSSLLSALTVAPTDAKSLAQAVNLLDDLLSRYPAPAEVADGGSRSEA